MPSFFIGKTIFQGNGYYNLEKHPGKRKENDHQQTAVLLNRYRMNQPVICPITAPSAPVKKRTRVLEKIDWFGQGVAYDHGSGIGVNSLYRDFSFFG